MRINTYKKSGRLIGFILSIVMVTATGCNNKKQPVISDTPTSGSIDISVDESFKPVIDEQIKKYLKLHLPVQKLMFTTNQRRNV